MYHILLTHISYDYENKIIYSAITYWTGGLLT